MSRKQQRARLDLRGNTFTMLPDAPVDDVTFDAEGPVALVRLADTPGPAAHGHVLWHDGELYRRVPVRIPLELLDELSTGPIAPADHRTTHILSMQREMMTDASLNAVHRDKATVKP